MRARLPPLRPALLITALLFISLLQACAGWGSFDTPTRSKRAAPTARTAALGSGQYRVQPGDTVYSIAFRNNLDYHELARWNGIGSDYLIRNGQLLRLTAPSRSAQASAPAPVQTPVPAPPRAVPPGRLPPVEPPTVTPPAAVVHAQPDGSEPVVVTPSAVTPAAPAPTAVVSTAPAVADPGETPELGNTSWFWPTLGPVSRGFGQQGSKGLDFSGKEGQPVFAAASGRVVYSGNALKGYGELIIVKHDETYLSAYGYNSRRNVKEGDIVTAGQPIAEMGLGPENRPLLHFEIRERGQPINPASKLPPRAAIR